MRISDLVTVLTEAKATHGDLVVNIECYVVADVSSVEIEEDIGYNERKVLIISNKRK